MFHKHISIRVDAEFLIYKTFGTEIMLRIVEAELLCKLDIRLVHNICLKRSRNFFSSIIMYDLRFQMMNVVDETLS